MRLLGRSTIDFESNFVVLHHQSDDAAMLGEMWYIADRECTEALCGLEYYAKLVIVRRTDEQNVAR